MSDDNPRPRKLPPHRSIAIPSKPASSAGFKYVNAASTDIRATFRRVIAAMKKGEKK